MTKLLQDKVAIITGAGSGMGQAMAKSFAFQGAQVVGADFDEKGLNQTIKDITSNQQDAIGVKTDVSSSDQIKNLFKTAKNEFGKIDIVVNNAGIMDHFEPVGDISDQTWQRVFNIDVNGVMYGMREAVKEFLPQQKGVILNTASVGGIFGGRGGIAYTAAKHAVVGLTKNTAYMYENKGIRTNAIAPGGVQTNIGKSIGKNVDQFGFKRQSAGMSVFPKIGAGTPQQIANAALFLVSDQASFINGVILPVDGGWTTY